MFEVLAELCKECRGQCCSTFKVYDVGKDQVLHMVENLRYEKVHKEQWELCSDYIAHSFEKSCFFYRQGGCPGMVKPPKCKEWFCMYHEWILFGNSPSKDYIGLSNKVRLIYRSWIK